MRAFEAGGRVPRTPPTTDIQSGFQGTLILIKRVVEQILDLVLSLLTSFFIFQVLSSTYIIYFC